MEPIFEQTAEQFGQYDDPQISFIDHRNSVLGEQFDIEHIFAFEDDFQTLGMILAGENPHGFSSVSMTRVPVGTGDIHPDVIH